MALHVFGDSSQGIFCSVAFHRGKLSSIQSTRLAFVLGKARVAPMKPWSILKLVIQASLLAPRLKDDILRVLIIALGRTVIQLHQPRDKQPTFAAKKASEVFAFTTVDLWNHVDTSDNTAHAGTGGLSTESLFHSCWPTGPLVLLTSEWPFQPKTSVKGLLKKATSKSLPENVTNFCQ